jgi:hypothetical protein
MLCRQRTFEEMVLEEVFSLFFHRVVLPQQFLWFSLLVMQSLQDVTGAEFKMFMDFLKGLTLFNDKAPPERIQELLEIVEGQADLDAVFTVCSLSCFCFPHFSLTMF